MHTLERPTWWDRNWRWFLPVICVTGVGLFAAFFISIFLLVMGMMKSSGAYQQAMSRASREPAVVSAIGQPVASGYLITGNINTSGDSGRARLAIPLRGPKGSASLHLRATEQNGHWTFSLLTVNIPSTHQQVDLLLSPPDARTGPAK
jgi:hypothetical protein